MPIYEYRCSCGAEFDRHLPVARYDEPQKCGCGMVAEKVVSVPIVFASQEILYQSPIDGRPITSLQARKEDLARHGCQEYDPEMKTDYHRRQKESDAALDRMVDETVDREIALMPARKRETLEAELINAGVTAEPVRLTAPLKPIKTEIHHG